MNNLYKIRTQNKRDLKLVTYSHYSFHFTKKKKKLYRYLRKYTLIYLNKYNLSPFLVRNCLKETPTAQTHRRLTTEGVEERSECNRRIFNKQKKPTFRICNVYHRHIREHMSIWTLKSYNKNWLCCNSSRTAWNSNNGKNWIANTPLHIACCLHLQCCIYCLAPRYAMR